MDITTVFGTVIPGSSPGRWTLIKKRKYGDIFFCTFRFFLKEIDSNSLLDSYSFTKNGVRLFLLLYYLVFCKWIFLKTIYILCNMLITIKL